jgi:hypothetical protein
VRKETIYYFVVGETPTTGLDILNAGIRLLVIALSRGQ